MAKAADALVAELSSRLDALVASWELAIRTQRGERPATSSVVRDPADVLAELERALGDVEAHCVEQRRAVDAEAREADDSERRAMMSLREVWSRGER